MDELFSYPEKIQGIFIEVPRRPRLPQIKYLFVFTNHRIIFIRGLDILKNPPPEINPESQIINWSSVSKVVENIKGSYQIPLYEIQEIIVNTYWRKVTIYGYLMIIKTYDGKEYKWNLKFEDLEKLEKLIKELDIPFSKIRK
ncbi:MAG: hypothetical protein ACUVXA_09915 [Candidatus Jordarchaeum sp.]|uniref:hypothetical protein n=1 Tax=Candidatus Jordarchaeum sp. TaxID=2823881 RepID=UPI0040496296